MKTYRVFIALVETDEATDKDTTIEWDAIYAPADPTNEADARSIYAALYNLDQPEK